MICLTLNISRMLTASTEDMEEMDSFSSAPARGNTPKPSNWPGVKAGLQQAKDAIESRDLDTAEQLLRETLEFAPSVPETWHILAAVLNRKGQVAEARQCLKRVIKLNQTDILLHPDLPVSKRMAKVLWSQGDHETALNMLAELLLNSPEDAELKSLQQTWTASS